MSDFLLNLTIATTSYLVGAGLLLLLFEKTGNNRWKFRFGSIFNEYHLNPYISSSTVAISNIGITIIAWSLIEERWSAYLSSFKGVLFLLISTILFSYLWILYQEIGKKPDLSKKDQQRASIVAVVTLGIFLYLNRIFPFN